MQRSRPIFTTFKCIYSHYETTEKTEKNSGHFFSGLSLIRAF